MLPKYSVIISLIFICTAISSVSAQAVRVTLIQPYIAWGDVDSNIALSQEKVLSIEESDIIILPELFTSGCDMQKRDKEIKYSIKQEVAARYNDIIEVMQGWSKQSGAVIVGSTIFQEEGLLYNRLLAVYPSGEYTHYDKHNCFKKDSFSPGADQLVIEVNGHRFATYICYDLRFSQWSKNEGRYDSAIYIANWPTSRAEDWHNLLQERALENQAYVIGVNCVGEDPAGIHYMGESMVIAPDGSVAAKCDKDKETILIIEY